MWSSADCSRFQEYFKIKFPMPKIDMIGKQFIRQSKRLKLEVQLRFKLRFGFCIVVGQNLSRWQRLLCCTDEALSRMEAWLFHGSIQSDNQLEHKLLLSCATQNKSFKIKMKLETQLGYWKQLSSKASRSIYNVRVERREIYFFSTASSSRN